MGWRIFHRAGLAFCCRSRLSSNVRPHTNRYRWPSQHREQSMPKTVPVQLSRFGHRTSQEPLLGRTECLNKWLRGSSLGFHVCASREAAGALGAGFVNQFLEPAAVRSAAAPFSLVRGGRQVRGGPAWSARSGLPSLHFTKISYLSGTLHIFPLLPL